MYRNRHRKPRHFKTCLFPHITNEDEKQGECRQRRGDLCFVIGVQTPETCAFRVSSAFCVEAATEINQHISILLSPLAPDIQHDSQHYDASQWYKMRELKR